MTEREPFDYELRRQLRWMVDNLSTPENVERGILRAHEKAVREAVDGLERELLKQDHRLAENRLATSIRVRESVEAFRERAAQVADEKCDKVSGIACEVACSDIADAIRALPVEENR